MRLVVFLSLLICAAVNAHAQSLQDLREVCRKEGVEHVFMFTDPTLQHGIDISHSAARDIVGWDHPKVEEECGAEYLALAHCHFHDYPNPHFPSGSNEEGGGDIVSLVLHEANCAAIGKRARGSPRIEHMVVVVETGEVIAYQLGPILYAHLEVAKEQQRLGANSPHQAASSGSHTDPEVSTTWIKPPVIHAVLWYSALRAYYLPYCTVRGVRPDLPDMTRPFSDYMTARSWFLP